MRPRSVKKHRRKLKKNKKTKKRKTLKQIRLNIRKHNKCIKCYESVVKKYKKCLKKCTKKRKKRRRRKKHNKSRSRPRKINQKGGAIAPGQWLKYDEIEEAVENDEDEKCVFCKESLLHPTSEEKTVFMLTCTVDDNGNAHMAHTECLKTACQKAYEDGKDLECPECLEDLWGSCITVDPEVDNEEELPYKINPHDYYRPIANAPQAGGRKKKR
jgi:hypothetical protein